MDITEFFERLSNGCFNKIECDRRRVNVVIEGHTEVILHNIDLLAKELHMLVDKQKEDKLKAEKKKPKIDGIFIIDAKELLK